MDKIYVAKIGKSVGLKGWQKIYIDSDFPEQFKSGTILYTKKNQELKIESYNEKNDSVKFVGIDDIESAKKLTNQHLFVTSESSKENCKLDKNQFFWFDIMDCEIFENGELLGKVSDIQRLPLGDYLFVDTSKDLVSKEKANSFLIPYLDEYIINVDVESKKIDVKNALDILDAS
jgi:16S rRNA processing protein RimM